MPHSAMSHFMRASVPPRLRGAAARTPCTRVLTATNTGEQTYIKGNTGVAVGVRAAPRFSVLRRPPIRADEAAFKKGERPA